MQYKLIREYPNSPQLGTIVSLYDSGMSEPFYTSDDVWSSDSIKEIEDYPEYWEIVKVQQYKLRAEGSHDVIEFLKSVGNEFLQFEMVRFDGIPDVSFEFTTRLGYNELVNILKEQNDAHVMWQTLQPSEKYTGDRNPNV